MAQAYIVDAARSAGGRRAGRLAGWHPVELAAHLLDALLERTQCDPALVDDVIMGCVSQVGEQSSNVARNAVLASRLPEATPATTIDRQCGSSQQALHFAAQAVMSGVQDVVIAAGVESMTRVPMFTPSALAQQHGMGSYLSAELRRRYGVQDFSQFVGADMLARKYDLSRDALDRFALRSHQLAARASDEGRFGKEIVPVPVRDAGGAATGELHLRDEGIRADASLAAISGVRLLTETGRVSAASASQICDGASAALVANERGLKALGAEPIARIHHMAVIGHDPVIMLEAPIPASLRALAKAGLKISDIALYEVNEAFAPVPLAWLRALDADPQRLNVHGGAIALGHPLGASGTRLLATLLHALQQRNARYGLQTMCEGGGMANVTIVERL